MTAEEYASEETAIFEKYKIPEELKGPLSYYAYERGHSAGYDECVIILRGLCSDLSDGIQKLIKRLS